MIAARMSNSSSLEGGKKRKRTQKFYGLHTFAEPGCPIFPCAPFRDSIKIFLQECAELEDYNVDGMPVWCTSLVHEDRKFVLPLYTIIEDVRHSLTPFCDHCRCAGWSHHFVSKRKYHMIIPSDTEWNKPLDDGILDLSTHLLHGLIHSNGYGHLLCINGHDGGSKYLCGREVMDLWDRLCTNLQARQITVEDVSKKQQMELRLLYGVAYGHTWFGKWGYRFCHGSFGLAHATYDSAIQVVSSLELDQVIDDFRLTNKSKEIKEIIKCYRDLSDTRLNTMSDLLRFMLALKSRAVAERKSQNAPLISPCPSLPWARTPLHNKSMKKERSPKCRKFTTLAANLGSRWPVKRLEYVANVVVDALKEKRAATKSRHCVLTRQEARDAARVHIGDTGLIDYVLSSMNNVIVGCYLVRRAKNQSGILEYSIQELKDRIHGDQEPIREPEPACKPGNDVYGDVSYWYKNVILDYSKSEVIKLAVQTVLDCKHFVKEWPFKDEQDDMLRFICKILPNSRDLGTELTRTLPPGDYVMVPLHATIGDLKLAIQTSMSNTYCIMEQLLVTDIEGMESFEDNEVLFGKVESGAELWYRGFGLDLGTDMIYEGGADNWTVRCKCGAQDDDGERMVSCDICEVWQHTRCCGIGDAEAVPPLFVCDACCASLAPTRAHPTFISGQIGPTMMTHLPEYDIEMYY